MGGRKRILCAIALFICGLDSQQTISGAVADEPVLKILPQSAPVSTKFPCGKGETPFSN